MTDLTTALSERFDSYTGKDALNLLATVLLVVIVVPFVIYAVPQVVGAEQSYVVMSGSMEPTIGTGDVVIVNEVPASEIEEGDVITFDRSATEPPTTHRVIGVEESGGERVFRTKGDNNEDPDASPVAAANVRGKVMELPFGVPGADHSLFVIPLIGRVIVFSQSTMGLVLLVLAPFALLAGSELLAFVQALRGEEGDGTDAGHAPSEMTADGVDGRTVAAGAPVEKDSNAEHEPGSEAVEEDDEGGFTISTRVLTIAVGALAAVGTFAGMRAYETREPVMATVAAGAVAGCVLIVLLMLFGSGEEPDAGAARAEPLPVEQIRTDGAAAVDSAGDAPADRVVPGRIPPSVEEWPRERVESPTELAERAADRGTCVIRDVEDDEYVLLADGVARVAPLTAPTDGAETSDEGTGDSPDGDDDPETEVDR